MAMAAHPSLIIPAIPAEKVGFKSTNSSADEEAPKDKMVVSCTSHRGSTAGVLLLPEFSNKHIVLGGRYEYEDSIDAMIGMGAFGIVFKGEDTVTNASVAIKRIPKLNVKENELKMIRSLKSDYLVGVLDICRMDDVTCCLVMELCDSDLDQHMRNVSTQGRLSPSNFRTLLDNIARGYKALYEMKIVHRDIKPQNILVSYRNHSPSQIAVARITDFGIARTLDDEQGAELCNVAGTFYYMAPEVGANLLKTCQYDFKVDMWSIGCLLYQCVAGEVPFEEGYLCRLFLYTACANYEAYDLPEIPSTVDPEVVKIIHSLLAIDPSFRCNPTQFYNRATNWSQSIH
ncbi:unnamed protein product [Caenorhabditis auriculariae]|uniref:Protein kinase domain-containing protein n=1 Tax=Caenorhabditis auriculariae TaxID=2777116 RepID=A0A8S1GPC3_9PELO|nr:unnamed protein product [Caenorhabditis auriculariae]